MALQPVSGIWGDKYSPDYVTALKKQVPDIHILGADSPLMTSLEYWWIKMEWLAPWNEHLRPCLWIDLDTFVFDLEPFNQLDTGDVWLIDNFNSPAAAETGLMVLPKDTKGLWDALMTSKINFRSPDAHFLRNFPHKRMNRVVNGIYSYKNHCIDEKPEDAVVCCFHGKPKAHETEGWAKQYWKTLT